MEAGARVLWANTVLFAGHPLENVCHAKVSVVGQQPEQVQLYDDKWFTNSLLRQAGLPVPSALLRGTFRVPRRNFPGDADRGAVTTTESLLPACGEAGAGTRQRGRRGCLLAGGITGVCEVDAGDR